MDNNFLLQVLVSLMGAVGVYAGIRADLAHLKATSEHHQAQIEDAKDTAYDAHKRITSHVEAHHMRRAGD